MKVVVQGEPTDRYSPPDDHDTLGEFLDHVNQQAGRSNRVVNRILVDGRNYSDEMDSLNCSEVDELQLEITTLEDLTIESIAELGEYCQRYFRRLPEISSTWEQIDQDERETYREQVKEALFAAAEILRSIELLTNLKDPSEKRKEMAQQASSLRATLAKADLEQCRTFLKNEVLEFFEDLLKTLQDTLDRFEQRQQDLINQSMEVVRSCDRLLNEINDVLSRESDHGASLSEFYDLETSQRLAEHLTDVNRLIKNVDESGAFKTAFPPDQQGKVKRTLRQLREHVPRLFFLLDEPSPEIRRVLSEDITAHVQRVQRYIKILVPEQDIESHRTDKI